MNGSCSGLYPLATRRTHRYGSGSHSAETRSGGSQFAWHLQEALTLERKYTFAAHKVRRELHACPRMAAAAQHGVCMAASFLHEGHFYHLMSHAVTDCGGNSACPLQHHIVCSAEAVARLRHGMRNVLNIPMGAALLIGS